MKGASGAQGGGSGRLREVPEKRVRPWVDPWEGLSALLDAQAHLRSAAEDFAALRTTDPIRSAAYDVKIALARKIMGECA